MAHAGYAIVGSRDESRFTVIDLGPLLQYFRTVYFTTEENYLSTTDLGPGDSQWPHTFAAAPEARPTIHATFDVTRPSVLAAGYPVGDHSHIDENFGYKAYIAREDGALDIYDMGEVMVEGRGAEPALIDTLPGCLNPTRIDRGGRNGRSRDTLAVACRGERAVLIIDAAGQEVKRLEDSRFFDVVDVMMTDSDGVEMISVADYSGGKVFFYLNGPIRAWAEELYGGLGPDGNDLFEFGGSWEGGAPFAISASMVP